MPRIFIALLLLPLFLMGQNLNFKSLQTDFAKEENRIKERNKLNERIDRVFSSDITSSNQGEWIKLFDDITIYLYTNDKIRSGMEKGFNQFDRTGVKFRRMFMETVYTLYPQEYYAQVLKIFEKTKDEEVYAYTVNYLLNNKNNNRDDGFFLNNIKDRFGKNPPLTVELLKKDLERRSAGINTVPSVSDLLHAPFQQGKTIIFSLHRKNRKNPGITIIRKPDGSFVKDKNGEIFALPQMAASASGLPYYLRGGDTPQGIFSIQGWYVSPTPTLGPTPAVLTRIPFEKPPKTFFHGKNKYGSWNIEDYKNLLPENWKDYEPAYEAFYGGKAGRGLIVMHGSVDDLTYYEGKSYYPMTPTKGCISAKEIWDPETGKIIESDQYRLMEAFASTKQDKGFLVVIEIDDKDQPVTKEEVLNLINR